MRADLDDLLAEAGGDPTSSLDPDAVWAAGRRRRLTRRASAAAASIAIVAVAVTALTAGGFGVPTIDPMGQGTGTDEATAAQIAAREAARQEAAEAAEAAAAEAAARAEQEAAEAAAEAAAEEQAAAEAQAEAEAEEQAAFQAAMADPCDGHEHRTTESFIEVVSPYDGQQVSGSIDLIGCSNVYEATVRYRITAADGTVVADHFTTATSGSGQPGEYRETIDLGGATGELTVEVFWDDAASGEEAADDPERDKVTLTIVAE